MTRTHSEKDNSLFISDTDWNSWISTSTMKLDSCFTAYAKLKQWKGLDVRDKMETLPEETLEGKIDDVVNEFSDRIIKT